MATTTKKKPAAQAATAGVGRIARVTGPVVDIEFPHDAIPGIYNALSTTITIGDTSSELILEVAPYLDDFLAAVRGAGMQMCCGGIIGMGEDRAVRYRLLQQLASLDPHPESVPINTLVAVEGTPLADKEMVDPLDLVRMIATTRIVMPKARVRLSAGRSFLSREAQILCLVAGANSIFYGEKLLTTHNSGVNEDDALFSALAPR